MTATTIWDCDRVTCRLPPSEQFDGQPTSSDPPYVSEMDGRDVVVEKTDPKCNTRWQAKFINRRQLVKSVP
ncbi:unnamed protein product [Haemonchus placei]|uniref:DUF5641 domain-containing protein n=1 Tax=Haemonchus placei TaxID=6290 RepID=A0A0N4X9X5_HAEPC|nr:unnamed protein product [Haemonchus placei]